MILVNLTDGQHQFPTATRVSTDEHNNLEIWGGDEGDDLLWVCHHSRWGDVSIGDSNGGINDPA